MPTKRDGVGHPAALTPNGALQPNCGEHSGGAMGTIMMEHA
jgi:hypothetical protein